MTPSAPTELSVLGQRTTANIAVCGDQKRRDRAAPRACPMVVVHRFDVLCGETPTAWSDVAAAIARSTKLQIPVAAPDSAAAPTSATSCSLRPATAPGEALSLSCTDAAASGKTTRVAIPAGYAPFGALDGAAAQRARSAAVWSQTHTELVAVPEQNVAAAEPATATATISSPAVEVASAANTTSGTASERGAAAVVDAPSGVARAADAADKPMSVATPLNDVAPLARKRAASEGWLDLRSARLETVRLETGRPDTSPGTGSLDANTAADIANDAEASHASTFVDSGAPRALAFASTNLTSTLLVVALVTMLMTAVAVRARFSRDLQPTTARSGARARVGDHGQRPATRPRTVGRAREVDGAASVEAMIVNTRARLAELDRHGPLAEVLEGELNLLTQRLAMLEAAVLDGDDGSRRAAAGLRSLVREIERIGRIIDSAALSIGRAAEASRMPATPSEAYALLGLNPDAADATLKKVADGLRMSWHPDHARSPLDRTEREARVKAINAAVDIIRSKRAA